MKLIYLASPYSYKGTDENEKIRVENERFTQVIKVAAKLIQEGHFVFSPIIHCHPIAINHKLPGDWQFWKNYGTLLVNKCDRFIVVKLDGWEHSTGVKAEIDIAKGRGLEIEYLDICG